MASVCMGFHALTNHSLISEDLGARGLRPALICPVDTIRFSGFLGFCPVPHSRPFSRHTFKLERIPVNGPYRCFPPFFASTAYFFCAFLRFFGPDAVSWPFCPTCHCSSHLSAYTLTLPLPGLLHSKSPAVVRPGLFTRSLPVSPYNSATPSLWCGRLASPNGCGRHEQRSDHSPHCPVPLVLGRWHPEVHSLCTYAS